MPSERKFKQVDVFTHLAYKGNPLAVILDADGLSDEQMQDIARWTHLSETTFVFPPTDPAADYQVRIFTPVSEFPFAGHPTLGTAHALLEAGLKPHVSGQLIQQCGIGLVSINIAADGQLAFRAPEACIDVIHEELYPLIDATLQHGLRDHRYAPASVRMGTCWITVRMETATTCLNVRPDLASLESLLQQCQSNGLALYGPHDNTMQDDYEVRVFTIENGQLVEDPVTGSANACIARLLQMEYYPDNMDTKLKLGYSVRQGTILNHSGRVKVAYIDGHPWIGGYSQTLIDGIIKI
ncbi:PhzF family phenazine biosynthesis protein [Pectobacteriaceae bacterium CE70]|uniref:PhzF family phenazine biosynthesis protein n=1 Tax=Serratia sp. (strain ATCC 39006) TaxID=104623 RepID=A0A2I5T6L9_SERS3|nr:PhzF family phenazine biosynthesis protein [Serratia sp. ATCC 39006]AUH00213.1 PhzF family phenazine biosynthesis protein [Serratia sp. ATCC 39006]AUH04533.1 PhzF family phenazine biosynthesis protein [Serratia sp. ATCC 39006]WJV65562.1 PhzF family phenazine biosynthesis protein [Pectobacteriaceae bacterium CE70]WJY09582.1 PhzF family phenazine biosynthesis protein [Pectobacteriaceae bacterium C80]